MTHEILTDEIISKIILINNQKLQVFEDGRVDRWYRGICFRLVKNTDNVKGYNSIKCNGKLYYRHRIIGFAFLGLDIDNVLLQIDHRNGDKLNNNVYNLRIVNQQGNNYNNTIAKGYYLDKQIQKYRARLQVNGKNIHLGCFDNEEDARNSYLEGKKIHHIIPEYNTEK